MKPKARQLKGRKHAGKRKTEDYIIFRIPKNNPEPTIKCLILKYSYGGKK